MYLINFLVNGNYQDYKMEDDYIGLVVNINNEEWRVAQKVFRYGREWQYILSHENVDGTYKSMNLNENALERIIESGSKVIGEIE